MEKETSDSDDKVPGIQIELQEYLPGEETDTRSSTKPLSSVWKHYEVKRSTKGNKKWAVCNYCHKDMYPHCDRMRRHLVICSALGSYCEKKGIDRFSKIGDVMKKTPKNEGTAKRSNTTQETVILQEEEEVEESDDEEGNEDEGVRLVSQLFANGLPKDVQVRQVKKREQLDLKTTHEGKKIKSLTDAELEREVKELKAMKLRMDLKLKRKQTLLYTRLNNGYSKFMKAVDVYLESNSTQRVTVYTGEDGENIIQASFQAAMQHDPSQQHTLICREAQDLTFDRSKANISYSTIS